MASPLQPPEHIETNNDDQPGAEIHTGPVQPGDLIDFTV
jgi:hypothetical protein